VCNPNSKGRRAETSSGEALSFSMCMYRIFRYGSAAELMAAMDEIEAQEGGLEAFLASLESEEGEDGDKAAR